ncbi:hypothetical protein [Streptomyces sp. SID3343]|uniref:hypothetical protein n=1 Tax=Streptomyces sp. SID3343 TaxID=2690260 RepID=UPI00136E3E3D|nr:hypothetical protein [Streptomyces sp. SID3343]MYW00389.1 hypothetical protein [Streptomyces sp. SID3343]MYW04592.1 hypothetical protein [Streptomyces sp. SID3343]
MKYRMPGPADPPIPIPIPCAVPAGLAAVLAVPVDLVDGVPGASGRVWSLLDINPCRAHAARALMDTVTPGPSGLDTVLLVVSVPEPDGAA